MGGYTIDCEVEVFMEASVPHTLLRTPVCRGNDADVNDSGLCVADPAVLLLLEEAETLDLEWKLLLAILSSSSVLPVSESTVNGPFENQHRMKVSFKYTDLLYNGTIPVYSHMSRHSAGLYFLLT